MKTKKLDEKANETTKQKPKNNQTKNLDLFILEYFHLTPEDMVESFDGYVARDGIYLEDFV